MDRISELPPFIVHRILSCLDFCFGPPVDLVRMSVLSKTWFDLTASFPILNFECDSFDLHVSRESFFKYVEYTTSRFCQKNFTAHRLYLNADLEEPAEIDIVNRCLELVLKQGVRELLVDITNFTDVQRYRLPDALLSVPMLESLTINCCDLPSSLMVDVVNLKSLIELKLEEVSIDDEGIKHLTTGCPLLQELTISMCHGFKRFCIPRHQNLQRVSIDYNTLVERIDIEAPNLSHLTVVDKSYMGGPQMNLALCKKLTRVTYNGYPLPDDFISNFPFVENLYLVTFNRCNNLKWSSHSLRTLMLESDCNLDEIDLNTPNLALFVYGSSRAMTMDECCRSLSRDPTDLKLCMRCYPECYTDTLWFQKLRLFLNKKNSFKVFNLYIHAVYSRNFIKLEELNAIELPPYELEHVELQLDTHEESLAHINFVDAVLWCCRPRSLALRSSLPSIYFIDVIKFIREKLLQQDHCHTIIQIVTCVGGKTISFTKKEVVQEEAG